MGAESPAEPVIKKDAIQAAIVQLLGAVAVITAAGGWWDPTPAQLVAIGGVGASVWSFITLVVSFRTRAKVTPVANRARPVPVPLQQPPAA